MLPRTTSFGQRHSILHHVLLGSLALVFLSSLAGCGGYTLRGVVIEGSSPGVFVVDAGDSRLRGDALPSAHVGVVLDPDKLSSKTIGKDVADGAGRFGVVIAEFGAGVLEYEVEVTARLAGHRSASRTMPLPAEDKRLLIVLTPGRDDRPAGGETLLEETLRLGEPYMNGR